MNAITTKTEHAKCAETGLTLPLSRSLGSLDLAKHKALLAVELEVLAKKFDRFGWERDRGTAAHDRIITDWMEALQDYPLDEVKAACRQAVLSNPGKMPNEGHIVAHIRNARKQAVAQRRAKAPKQPERNEPRVTAESAAKILEEVGLAPKRFGRAK